MPHSGLISRLVDGKDGTTYLGLRKERRPDYSVEYVGCFSAYLLADSKGKIAY